MSPSAEKDEIKDLNELHMEMESNDIFYIVSSKWYTQWKEYVRYDQDDDSGEPGGSRPDSIDNTPLLAGAMRMNGYWLMMCRICCCGSVPN